MNLVCSAVMMTAQFDVPALTSSEPSRVSGAVARGEAGHLLIAAELNGDDLKAFGSWLSCGVLSQAA